MPGEDFSGASLVPKNLAVESGGYFGGSSNENDQTWAGSIQFQNNKQFKDNNGKVWKRKTAQFTKVLPLIYRRSSALTVLSVPPYPNSTSILCYRVSRFGT